MAPVELNSFSQQDFSHTTDSPFLLSLPTPTSSLSLSLPLDDLPPHPILNSPQRISLLPHDILDLSQILAQVLDLGVVELSRVRRALLYVEARAHVDQDRYWFAGCGACGNV